MTTLLDRFGDIFSVIMSPLWNHPERMQKVSRFLMRCFTVMLVIGVLVWLSQRPVFSLKQIQVEPVAAKKRLSLFMSVLLTALFWHITAI